MRVCIWCRKNEEYESFEKRAHTIPQSLGGENICENVCDSCNHFFGSPKPNTPASELVLKEMLNISKYYLFHTIKSFPKNKRYKSEYFNVNWKNEKLRIKLKQKYKLRKGFQKILGRQFRKGLFKVFLEERERQRKDALSDRFNFIREFARYDIGNYPVYVQIPKFGAVFFSLPEIEKPQIRFTDYSDNMNSEYRIYDYQLFGHNFLIPTSPLFEKLCLDKFLKHLKKEDHPFGTSIRKINYAEDIDYLFRYMNN